MSMPSTIRLAVIVILLAAGLTIAGVPAWANTVDGTVDANLAAHLDSGGDADHFDTAGDADHLDTAGDADYFGTVGDAELISTDEFEEENETADREEGQSVTGDRGDAKATDRPPGASLSGFVANEQRTIDGELRTRTYGVQLANAQTPDERAAVLERIADDLDARMTAVERFSERHDDQVVHPGRSAYVSTSVSIESTIITQQVTISWNLANTVTAEERSRQVRERFDSIYQRSVDFERTRRPPGDREADTDGTVRVGEFEVNPDDMVPADVDLDVTVRPDVPDTTTVVDIDGLNASELRDLFVLIGFDEEEIDRVAADELAIRLSLLVELATREDAEFDLSELDGFEDLDLSEVNLSKLNETEYDLSERLEVHLDAADLASLGIDFSTIGDLGLSDRSLSTLSDAELAVLVLAITSISSSEKTLNELIEERNSFEDSDGELDEDLDENEILDDDDSEEDGDGDDSSDDSDDSDDSDGDSTDDLDEDEDDSDEVDGDDDAAVQFEVTDVEIQTEIMAGEDLVSNVTVTNTGENTDRQTISLIVDSGVGTTDEQSLELAGNESRTISLVWQTQLDDVGIYEVTVRSEDDRYSISVEVLERQVLLSYVNGGRHQL